MAGWLSRDKIDAIASIGVGAVAACLGDLPSLKDIALGGYKLVVLGQAASLKWSGLEQTAREAVRRNVKDEGEAAQILELLQGISLPLSGGEIAARVRSSASGDPASVVVEAMFRELPFDGHDEAVRAKAWHVFKAVTEACLQDPQIHAEFERQSLSDLLRDGLRLTRHAERQDAALQELQAGMRDLLSELRSDRLPLRRPRILSPEEAGKTDFVAFSYERRMTEFIGREAERQALQEFLASEASFLWWQASGSGGQGKSRLALELLDGLDPSWDGGFLDADGLEKTSWDKIRFDEPTLIIVDYVAAPSKAEAFAKAARRLAQRAAGDFSAEAQLGARVRLLALEREGFDLSEDRTEGRLNWLAPSLQDVRLKAALRDSVFRPEPLHLETLPGEEMGRIMRSWREKTGKPPLSEDRLEERLKALKRGGEREGRAWRPLLAMMFADHDGEPESIEAGFESLLQRTLEQERQEFWSDKQGPRGVSAHLAALASMVGVVDVNALANLPDDVDSDLSAEYFYGGDENAASEILQGAWNACGRAFSWDRNSTGALYLEARTPDLLGEYLAIWILQHWVKPSLAYRNAPKKIERLARDAWTLNRVGFFGFLIRLKEDFPKHSVTRFLLNVIPRSENIILNNNLIINFANIGATGPLRAIISNNKDLSIDIDKYLNLGLFESTSTNEEEAMRILIDSGASPDYFHDESDYSPLIIAAAEGYEGAVRVLLAYGANPNQTPKRGMFPLLAAAAHGDEGTVRVLLEGGALPDKVDHEGLFPLLVASYRGHENAVRALLKKGADPNKTNSREGGSFPLQLAAYEGNGGTVQALLEGGADPNKTAINGFFPLLVAVERGHEEVVSLLLDGGALPNKAHENGIFPLLASITQDSDKLVRLLLKAGAKPNQVCSVSGDFPLLLAARTGSEICVRTLLDGGADPDQADKNGFFPLIMAAYRGYEAVVCTLLSHGADHSKINKANGAFPLFLAAAKGHKMIVDALIAAGASPRQVNKTNGDFPLLIAAAMGHEAVVRSLLEFGAPAYQIHESSKLSPLSLAEKRGHLGVVRLLKAALKPEA